MPRHLSASDLGRMATWAGQGRTPIQIHAILSRSRVRRGLVPPNLTTIRRALRGATHKRGIRETRGRKSKLTPEQLRRLNLARKRLIREAEGEAEVHIGHVMKKAHISHVAPSTVSKHFNSCMGIRWRTAAPVVGRARGLVGWRAHTRAPGQTSGRACGRAGECAR